MCVRSYATDRPVFILLTRSASRSPLGMVLLVISLPNVVKTICCSSDCPTASLSFKSWRVWYVHWLWFTVTHSTGISSICTMSNVCVCICRFRVSICCFRICACQFHVFVCCFFYISICWFHVFALIFNVWKFCTTNKQCCPLENKRGCILYMLSFMQFRRLLNHKYCILCASKYLLCLEQFKNIISVTNSKFSFFTHPLGDLGVMYNLHQCIDRKLIIDSQLVKLVIALFL